MRAEDVKEASGAQSYNCAIWIRTERIFFCGELPGETCCGHVMELSNGPPVLILLLFPFLGWIWSVACSRLISAHFDKEKALCLGR
jgi:hypothetical protein